MNPALEFIVRLFSPSNKQEIDNLWLGHPEIPNVRFASPLNTEFLSSIVDKGPRNLDALGAISPILFGDFGASTNSLWKTTI